jgi:aromatic ring hydroxylase
MHTSMTAISNEIFVCPGRAFKAGEEEYAVAFAVKPDTKGLKLIMRPGIASEAALQNSEGPRTTMKRMGESLTIFDDVFVPWERVFIYKDVKAASGLALLFALFHRLSAVSYRSALAEHFIGLGKLLAEANGIDGASHIAKDITDLIMYTEIQRACSRVACYECRIDKKSGIAIPNPIYTNTGKLYSNANYMKVMNCLIDIAGGAACTAPSGEDYANKELRPYISKYMRGAVSGEERFKLMLLIREQIALLAGEESVIYIHAEGSQEASTVELYRSYDYTEAKNGIRKMLSRMDFEK